MCGFQISLKQNKLTLKKILNSQDPKFFKVLKLDRAYIDK